MKTMLKHPDILMMMLLCIIIFASCDGPYTGSAEPDFTDEIAKPTGSTVVALGGNVTLELPEGAIEDPVIFQVNECLDNVECPYVLKLIRIDPLMTFNKPVSVTINYAGELANGTEINEGCTLSICYWDTEECFFNRVGEHSTSCCVDADNNVIRFCITQTGVYAIKMINEGGTPEME